MTLPVVEETVLQNMVQTVETNEEVRQEDLEAFLHLFKRNVSNKPKRVGRSTGSFKKKAEKQQNQLCLQQFLAIAISQWLYLYF